MCILDDMSKILHLQDTLLTSDFLMILNHYETYFLLKCNKDLSKVFIKLFFLPIRVDGKVNSRTVGDPDWINKQFRAYISRYDYS